MAVSQTIAGGKPPDIELMVIERDLTGVTKGVGVVESVAWNPVVTVPAAVGVPVIAPVPAVKVSPEGRAEVRPKV